MGAFFVLLLNVISMLYNYYFYIQTAIKYVRFYL